MRANCTAGRTQKEMVDMFKFDNLIFETEEAGPDQLLKYRFSGGAGGGAGDSDDGADTEKAIDKDSEKKDPVNDEKKKDEEKKDEEKKNDTEQQELTPEKVKKMIQSETDKVRTEYVKKLKALEKEKEELLKEKMTEEEKKKFEQEKREKELMEKEKLIREKEIRLRAINLLQENEMPISFQEYVLAETEEEVEKKILNLKELWKKELQAAVEKEFKAHGREPDKQKKKDTGLYTKEELQALTNDQIINNWEKVERSLANLGK